MTNSRQTKHVSAVEWARSLGSTATTHRGAVRFLRGRLTPSAYYDLRCLVDSFRVLRRSQVSEEDEAVRTNIWRYQCLGQTWMVPGAECLGPSATAKQIWKAYHHNLRMARRADRAAAERGITWTQEDALAEAERLTQADIERCHVAAKRRNAALDRKAMGSREMAVINRSVDDSGHPVILWRRKGEHRRRLTGWDDGHVWTVEVPSRLSTAEEALDWLLPEDADRFTLRQGEWFFLGVDYSTASYCDEAIKYGSAVESEEETAAGSWHRTEYRRGDWAQTRHRAQEVVVAQKHGEVAFVGDKGRVRTHEYTAKPRLYVRGRITAPDHADLVLDGWHEVVGNRAVGAPAAVAVGLD
jgi:hypothetical protein